MLDNPATSRPTLLRSPARFRRIATGSLLILAPLLAVIAAAVDPGTWGDDREAVSYGANPALAQVESVLYHWSWLLMALAMVGMLRLLARKGVIFGHVVGTLTVLGAINLSALMLTDPVEWWFGQHYPAEAERLTHEMLGLPSTTFGYQMPWMFFAVFGVPLLVAAVWRAGFAHWWVPLAAAAGYLGFMFVPYGPASLALSALSALALGTIGLRVLRMSELEWESLAAGSK
ncbi:hypothetical protein ACIBHX_18865 [Nonomuraea sp. NPDC050536]|uniref:hypothetical protein n=1 Tax=Nonomuraea sp. NPDC050536 TaxID=3364366 RepID=UPI0037C7804E